MLWYWHKDKHIEQWNSLEMNSHISGQIIFDNGTKTIQRIKHNLF